jgi:hypothetical protein
MIERIRDYGILPSMKQSHLRISISTEIGKNLEVGRVQSTMDRRP